MDKKAKNPEKDNSERWLLTYADLMNLLLILFIILFAMSQVDTEKFQQLSQSLSSAFGGGNPPSAIAGGKAGNSLISMPATMPSPVIPGKQEDQQMAAIEKEVTGLIKEKGLEGSVQVRMQERGIEITLNEKIMFDSGKVDIDKDSEQLILKIGKEILSNVQNKSIKIEGHTDNVPMNGNNIIKTNMDLSALRASNVASLLVEKGGIKKENIKAVGCGDSVPLVKNDSDAHRAMNRRVAIVILRDAFDASEAGSYGLQEDTTTSGSAVK